MEPTTAITPSTLLVLDEARFLKLLKSSKSLQLAVRDSAVARGVDPATLFVGLGLDELSSATPDKKQAA